MQRTFVLRYVTLFAISGVVLFGLFSGINLYAKKSDLAYVRGAVATSSTSTVVNTPTPVAVASGDVTHIATPTDVRAIYMSQCVVGTPSFRDSLVKFVDDSKLNSIIIDIKDFSGSISFPSTDPALAPYVSTACGAKDMKAFIQKLHEKGIYVIGRVTTFQDPLHAKLHPDWAVQKKGGGVWKNYGGLAFIDVGAKPFWDYIATLAIVSHDQMGFDEINFDYIRFPSDGPLSEAVFTYDAGKAKQVALEQFFSYLHDKMTAAGITTSADMFGLVSSSEDDLGIGQVLERAMPYFDYIDPMVYPSHYNKGFNGYSDVNAHPYDIVHIEMQRAVARAEATTSPYQIIGSHAVQIKTIIPATKTASSTVAIKTVYSKDSYPASKIRPWLQSFDYPVTYTPAMVTAQIKATTDAGLSSYLVWDAANKYRSLRSVLGESTTTTQ
ncbi:MAG: hypothetical protein JWO50_274 [Candidatus Kaiserbacteria bacterium]|nr:hypothetical protein [Candidatus Kaiserbacteria bacterium]